MTTIEIMHERVELHIQGVKEATNRSRNILIFISISALVILIAIFNTTFTWIRHINITERAYGDYYKTVGIDSVAASVNELRKHYADIYFDRQFFTIPLLGIKSTESDLSFLAPIAMLIFTTWNFFSLRRENHIVFEITKDFEKIFAKIGQAQADIEEWIILLHNLYSGSIQNFVLTTPTTNDFKSNKDDFMTNKIARPIITFLNWIPVIILLLVLSDDITEYFDRIYMRQHWIELMVLDSFLISLTLFIIYQTNINNKLNSNTRTLLKKMSDMINGSNHDYLTTPITETLPPTS